MKKSVVVLLTTFMIIVILSGGILPTAAQSGNLILNPEFDNGTTNWNLSLQGGAAASMAVVTGAGLSGTNSLKVTITNAGMATHHVQLNQTLGITSGKTYQISFMAKADAAKSIDALIQQDASPWTIYWAQWTINLTTTPASFGPYTFNSTTTDPTARLRFNLASDVDDVWIDNIVVIDTSGPTSTPTNTPVPPTNTPTNTPVGPTNTPTPTNTPVPTNTPTNTPLPTNTPTSTNTPVPGTTVRIEAGGTASYTDSGGNVWAADSGCVAGSGGIVDRGNIAIANTVDDKIYQTERWGQTSCNYTVPNGTYTVRLHFAETCPCVTAPGQRLFNLSVEGQAYNNLDVYVEAGGKNIALIKTWTVNLTDGQINIPFTTLVNASMINGIEIIPGVAPTNTPAPTNTSGPTPTPTNTPSGGQPPLTGNLSGKNWASGFFRPSQAQSDYTQFANWRGRPLDVAKVFPARDSWASITGASIPMYTSFAGFQGRLIISVPLFPSNIANATGLSQCAAGNYNSNWQTFGTSMVTNNRANSIVRVGWEFNGTFMYWWASNTTNWVNCFRNIVNSIRTTNPAVIIDWTRNAHGTPAEACGGLATNCYPGDAYVDIIGTDDYDMYPPAPTVTDFNNRANAEDGLNDVYNFAVAHNKWVSVGEWGVSWRVGNGGNDNPLYMDLMHDWFEAHDFQSGDKFIYEAYFDDGCDPTNVKSTLGPWTGCTNPNSAAQYLLDW